MAEFCGSGKNLLHKGPLMRTNEHYSYEPCKSCNVLSRFFLATIHNKRDFQNQIHWFGTLFISFFIVKACLFVQSKVALAVDLEDNLNSSIKALVANGYNNFCAKEDSIS